MAMTKSTSAASKPVIVAYVACGVIALAIYHFVAEQEFSALLTMAALMQVFGCALLCIQVITNKTATGISAGSLMLDAASFACRLSSTTWLQGYLPADKSGDHVYQLLDIASLCMVIWLLRQVLVVHKATYQVIEDSMDWRKMLLGCLVLGAIFHGNMDQRVIFDTLWMAGLFAGVVAVLPQLWLIMQTGGRVAALTSHYIAALALGRVLSGVLMWYARDDITCNQWMCEGCEHAAWAILSAHVVHLLLLGDFAYHYFLALSQGLTSEPMLVMSSMGNSLNAPSENMDAGGKWV